MFACPVSPVYVVERLKMDFLFECSAVALLRQGKEAPDKI
jgi:hypothetical protein